MRVVHCLEFDAILGALKVRIRDELLDSCVKYSVMGSTKEVNESVRESEKMGELYRLRDVN